MMKAPSPTAADGQRGRPKGQRRLSACFTEEERFFFFDFGPGAAKARTVEIC